MPEGQVLQETLQRHAIIETLASTPFPLTAADIHQRVRRLLPEFTLESTGQLLMTMKADGALTEIVIRGESSHYEIRRAPCRYFFCQTCRRVFTTTCDIGLDLPHQVTMKQDDGVSFGYCGTCGERMHARQQDL